MLERILETLDTEEFIIADGFDEAVIGFCEQSMRLIYSVNKCLAILQKDMNEEDANEYFWFNVQGAYVGEKTPIWCIDNI